MSEYKQLAVENLHISENHERSVWELADLVASIRDNGIQVALKVRQRPRKLGGYEILDGARRWKAAERVGLAKIPCIVEEVDDATAIAMQVDANGDRVPLHPVDEAAIFKRLVQLGWDAAALAKRFRRKKPEIARRLALCGLAAKVRGAFVDGVIDEEGALALARLEPKKQAEYLAAVEAGTLQLEEIAAAVARQESASLADVPWRVSDEKLVPEAGACTACPKRSSVQRDLFAEAAGDRCLDVGCFRGKMDVVFLSEAKKMAKADVLRGQGSRPDELFLPEPGRRPSLLTNSGYVDAETPCPYVTGQTWGKAVARAVSADEPVPLKLARDQDGRPRFLLREADVVKLVRRSDAAVEQKASARAADPVTSDEQADKEREAKRVRKVLIAKLTEAAISDNHSVWPWIAQRIIAGATNRDAAHVAGVVAEVLKREEAPDDPRKFLSETAGGSDLWAKRVATAILIREADDGDEFPEALAELAGIVGLDLKTAKRDARKGDE